MNLSKNILMNKVSEGQGGGGSTGYEQIPSSAAPQSQAQSSAQGNQNSSPSKEDRGELDQYGYKKIPTATEASRGQQPPATEQPKPGEGAQAPAQKPNETPPPALTGYETPPADPGTKPPATPEQKPGEEEKPPVNDELGYTVDTTGLPEESANKILNFAKKHKLPKEVVEEMVADTKASIAAILKAQEDFKAQQKQLIEEQRRNWHRELLEDPTFGGENFNYNLTQVNKLIDTLMPNTKKQLTERGGMLPPYLMKDYLLIATELFKTPTFVEGQPPVPKEDKSKEEYNPLDYYEKKKQGA